MFTSLWRSSNHLELSRQPEGPGLRCHLQLFTIDSINENRCCRYFNLAAVGDSSGPRRCLRPLFSDQEGDTALQPELSDEQKMISNPFFQWDLCAGAAILNSLGGRMTDIDGKEIHFDDETDFK